MNKIVTEELKEEITRLYTEENLTNKRIGKRLGISESVVQGITAPMRKAMREAGIKQERVVERDGEQEDEEIEKRELKEWLEENWHWKHKNPDRVRKSNFRTPCHPDGMRIRVRKD